MSNFTESYKNGVKEFYLKGSYKNPHAPVIQKLVQTHCSGYKKILDLGAGTGEATQGLRCEVTSVEPYLICDNQIRMTFEDIALGKLSGSWDAVISSFAMHLVEPSRLPQLLYKISELSENLFILSPHKKPVIENHLWDLKKHIVFERVHFRHYFVPLKCF